MKDSEEQHALRLAIYGNIFFTVAGLGFAFYTASQAVLLDGVFSAIALVLAVVGLLIYIPLVAASRQSGLPLWLCCFRTAT